MKCRIKLSFGWFVRNEDILYFIFICVDDLYGKSNLSLNAEMLSRFIKKAGKVYCLTNEYL